MARYTVEQVYRTACARYEIVKSVVCEMSELVRQAQGDLKDESAMATIDLIIQATLLNVAVTDGSFQEAEKQFIDVLTEYGDLIKFVNFEAKRQNSSWCDISWDSISELDAETKKKLGAIAGTIVDPYATSFVKIFASIDKLVEERDYIKILRESIEGIIVALSVIDGDDIDSNRANAEVFVGFSILDLLLTKKWEEVVK